MTFLEKKHILVHSSPTLVRWTPSRGPMNQSGVHRTITNSWVGCNNQPVVPKKISINHLMDLEMIKTTKSFVDYSKKTKSGPMDPSHPYSRRDGSINFFSMWWCMFKKKKQHSDKIFKNIFRHLNRLSWRFLRHLRRLVYVLLVEVGRSPSGFNCLCRCNI